jgi:general secretion pathway protein K
MKFGPQSRLEPAPFQSGAKDAAVQTLRALGRVVDRREASGLRRVHHRFSADGGSILVGLLWCLALLSVIVIGVLHTARMDLLVQKNYGDRIQAHYLALAGIEKARALLYRDAHDRSRNRKNHTGDLYDDEQQFRNVALGRGVLSVIHRGRPDEGGGIIFGVSDEESRLNVNTATADELAKLQNMTPDVATAIVNWRGGDNTTMAAEAQYYGELKPPYQPRLGPYQTVRELLMVRGVAPDLLLGRDVHQNGMLAMGEKNFAFPGSVESEDLGWAGIFTVDSSVQNLNAAGEDRVNIQNADESSLTAIHGITPPIARAIVAYRGQHRFQSIADLLDVTPPQNQRGARGANNSDQSGNRVVDENLFMDIADDVTTDTGQSLSGAINVNTASIDVLVCLPDVSRELAQAIISQRQSGGFFASTAELLKVPGMTRDIFKEIAPLVTARSETFRILSEGTINSTGVRQRIQAIVHVGLNDQKILSWREDDL